MWNNLLPTISSYPSLDSKLCFWWSHSFLLCPLKPAFLRSINLFIIKNKIHYLNWWWGCHTEKEIQMYWIIFPVFLGEPSFVGQPFNYLDLENILFLAIFVSETWAVAAVLCVSPGDTSVFSASSMCFPGLFLQSPCPSILLAHWEFSVCIDHIHLSVPVFSQFTPHPDLHIFKEKSFKINCSATHFGCVVFCWREVDWPRAKFLEKLSPLSPETNKGQ